MSAYAEFLARKALHAPAVGIAEPPPLHPALFPFQRDIARWALIRGRAAVFADCGLGKSWMALEWARVVAAETRRPVLILTPLAVAPQFVAEGAKLGVPVTLCRSDADVWPGVNVCNYDRLHLLNPARFAGIVADESSCLKDHTSATRQAMTEAFAATPFRLACTATPSPNDVMELGTHAEWLGVMTRAEMLAMFFTHDGGETQTWRLKGHAERDFWRWVCTWACAITAPSDLGYEDGAFRLPPLRLVDHRVKAAARRTLGADGQLGLGLGALEARTLEDQRAARRGTLADRVRLAADLVNATREPWVVWCDLNAESTALAAAIPDAVEVHGGQTVEEKEAALASFAAGRARVLVSKPSICGWGLNWQHCAHVAFVGLSHSFEAWYQAIRRTYRFGQTRPVVCHMISSDAEGAVAANLQRKQRDAERMRAAMIAETADVMAAALGATTRVTTNYHPTVPMELPAWLMEDAA